ncbi:hypothetical protein ABW20_dc0105316 [Dactylellina cionopaga]|nr:hypothetical protein ABW20_dc0105316 [Dactylellina cionopaga]
MEGCSAVLQRLPQRERFTVRFIAKDQPLQDKFEEFWREKYSSSTWLALEDDGATTFEILVEDANFAIRDKLARLTRIFEHLAQYEMFKEVTCDEGVTETSDVIHVEVLPPPGPVLQEANNETKTFHAVTNIELDKDTGLYQAEEKHLFRLKLCNNFDRKVHFTILVYSAEFSIDRLYPVDASYKTLTAVGSSNSGVEDSFDVGVDIADELREATGKSWNPVETYKIFASVYANDLVRLNSLTLEALAKLDLSPG